MDGSDSRSNGMGTLKKIDTYISNDESMLSYLRHALTIISGNLRLDVIGTGRRYKYL